MRNILISLLLASAVATPALADRPNRDDRAAARQERQDARQESRSDRQDNRSDARDSRPAVQAPQRTFAAPAQDRGPAQNVERQQWSPPARQVDARPPQQAPSPDRQQFSRPVRDAERPTANFGQNSGSSVASWRDQRDQVRDNVRDQREVRQANRPPVRVTPPPSARPDRPAPVPQTAYHYDRSRTPNWNTNWRNNHRYDWRDYRKHHRSLFHLGVYFDPFGWGYQRFGIGWRMWPSYYDQSYWLNDAYMYNLPYAPWPYVWVRYYDDAVLVNVFTGQVADVVYDFFW